uniref:Uncharacterized protein n=1 Tax=Nelumbo nucifera TaxID=4432 RepID=A0A822XXY4_NELNU|nr:TPA_asm: hypothetical protein HUJ06_026336 [Nelumbo nucifera]
MQRQGEGRRHLRRRPELQAGTGEDRVSEKGRKIGGEGVGRLGA